MNNNYLSVKMSIFQSVLVKPEDLSKYGDISTNKMKCALSAIALEMEKFRAGTSISCHNFGENEELFEQLNICKSNLRRNKRRTKQLKENVRKACIVAKTVLSAKENETMSLLNDINSVRSECADLALRNKLNTEVIQQIKAENKALHEKLQYLHEFIELGYQELQKMRNFPADNASTVIQLKEIMLSCGQYYADYCNERETRMQMEQKNRFLSNKIKILGTNINAIVEELKNLRYQNSKLRKENSALKNKHVKELETLGLEGNPYRGSSNKTFSVESQDVNHSFDMTTHLSLVKDLLGDQDIMLSDLKKLSEELNSSPNNVYSDVDSADNKYKNIVI